MYVFGTDEAGKGPVLGSMFAACVRVDADADPPVMSQVSDSKQLSGSRREALAAALRDHTAVEIGLAEIPVMQIDDPETDMNSLTVAAHAEALSAVARDGDAGIADAGDTSETRFARRVADAATVNVRLEAEHGADDAYPLVAGASVIAKVARDEHVASLADQYGAVGSGYSSDPATREFLWDYVRKNDGLPDCARASWSTAQDALAAAEQAELDEF